MKVRFYAVSAAVMVAALLGGLGYLMLSNELQAPRDDFAACGGGSGAADVAGFSGRFTLRDSDGRELSDREVMALPGLVYFGYGSCRDICPLDLDRNALATDILTEYGIELRPVFITLDPARDTPEELAGLVRTYHPEMVALTGAPDAVAAAAANYGVRHAKEPPGPDGAYRVTHSTDTYLHLPDRGPVAAFARDKGPDELAERVACYFGQRNMAAHHPEN